MAEDTHEPQAEPPGGVFGNLPSSRPGTRSPRRDGEGARGDAKKAPPATAQPRAEATGTTKPPPPPPPPPGGTRPAAPASRPSGLEDLAWAGVAVAAQAATLGVRAASRALEAVRKQADRG